MHLVGPMRCTDISQEFHNIGAILLPGTSRRKGEDDHEIFRHEKHWESSFGWTRAIHKSCGVSILMNDCWFSPRGICVGSSRPQPRSQAARAPPD
eukprot:3681009-Pyramimonas_sp.AAC.1